MLDRPWLLGIVLGVIFLVRLYPLMAADLWFDEVLTFDDYVMQPKLAGVFAQYPVANNHVLFSAMLWLWTRALDPHLFESLLRLPSALFSATVVMLACVHWRRWLGSRAALLAAVTFAASIVVANFAWQLRGYSMSMMLGAISLSGTMELLDGRRKRGLVLSCISAALLPIVLPTNVLLIGAHVVFLMIAATRDVGPRRWIDPLIVCVSGAIGSSYYLLILKQFVNVIHHAEGWPSGYAAINAWAMALLAHFGIIGAMFAWQQRVFVRKVIEGAGSAERDDVMLAWKVLVPAVGICVVTMLALQPAPFPRTFLVFLPTATFGVCYAFRNAAALQRASAIALTGIAIGIAVWGCGWQSATSMITANSVARGEYPQNLLLDFYRGRQDISQISVAIKNQRLGAQIVLLTDFHDFPTTRFYWRVQQLPAERVVAKFKNLREFEQQHESENLQFAVQAVSESHAKSILDEAHVSFEHLEPLLSNGTLTIFLVQTSDAAN